MGKPHKKNRSARHRNRPSRKNDRAVATASSSPPPAPTNDHSLQLPLPPQVAPVVDQALLRAEQKDFSQAMKMIRQAERLAPRNSSITVAKALVLEEQEKFEEAMALFLKAVQRDPEKDYLFDFMAHHARRRVMAPKETQKMIQLCRKASELRPDHLEMKATVAFLMVQSENHQLEEAEGILEEVLEKDPDQSIGLTALGIIRFHQYRYDEGETLLQRAQCELHGVGTGLIKIRIAQGKLEEAEEQCKHWIERHPNESAYYHLLIELLPASEITENWLERIEKLVERKPDAVLQRNMHFLKGVALEKKEKWDEAFENYHIGNGFYENHFSIEKFHRGLKMLAACFDRDFLSRAPKGSPDCEKPVFLVGMPRSGSTLTEQIISAHPQVQAAGENSILSALWNEMTQEILGEKRKSFTVRDLQQISPEIAEEAARKYLEASRKKVPADAPRITDKTLGNYQFLGLLEMLFPKAKIIHCRRHPLGSGFSCYKTNFAHSSDSLNYTTDLTSLGQYYNAYHQLMEYWRKELSIPIFQVVYEELVDNIEEVSRKLLDFCGLPWDEQCLEFYRNSRPAVTASEIQVKRPIYRSSAEKWKYFDKHLTPMKDQIRNILALWENDPPTSGIANVENMEKKTNTGNQDKKADLVGSEQESIPSSASDREHRSIGKANQMKKKKSSRKSKAASRRRTRKNGQGRENRSKPASTSRFEMQAPRAIAPMLETAIKLSRSGKRPQAYELVEKSMDKLPQDPCPWICKAIIEDEADKSVEASASLLEAAKRAPGNDSVFNLFADIAKKRIRANHEMKIILENCKEALSYYSDHAEMIASIAFLQIQVFANDPYLALETTKKALALDPDNTTAFAALGTAYFHLGKYEEAEEYLIRATETFSLPCLTRVQIRIAQGKLEEAKEMAYHWMKKYPKVPVYYLNYLELASAKEITPEWLEETEEFLTKNMDSLELRGLHFLSGKVYEKHGECEKAFQKYRQGNDSFENIFDNHVFRQTFKQLECFFHPEIEEKLPVCPPKEPVPIFLVGMPRSGSTLTEQILCSHPEIGGAGEVPFLVETWKKHFLGEYSFLEPNQISTNIAPEKMEEAAEEYLSEIRRLAPEKPFVTDKMLSNYRHIGLIQFLFPNAKIIHCRRHPMGTCFSCYKTNFGQSEGDLNYTTDMLALGKYYHLYYQFMENYIPHVSVPVFQTVYEEMVENLEETTRELLDFIGVPWDPKCLEFYKNERAATTASQIQVKRPLYKSSLDQWKQYEPYMRPVLNQIGDIVQQWESCLPKSGVVEKAKGPAPQSWYSSDFIPEDEATDESPGTEPSTAAGSGDDESQQEEKADFTVKTHPDFVPKLQQANQLAAVEAFPAALALVQECLERSSDDPALWLAKGDILIQAERVEEGLDCFLQMLRCDSRPDIFIPIFIDRLLSQKSDQTQVAASIDMFRRSMRMRPDSIKLKAALAYILADSQMIEKIEESEHLVAQVLEKMPEDAMALAAKGKSLFFRNRLEEAETILWRSIERGCHRCAPYLYLVRVSIAQGNLERAKEICIDYLREHPQQTIMYMKLMELLPNEEDLALLEGIEGEIHKNPSPVVRKQFHFLQGKLHEKRKNWETAFDFYMKGNKLYKKTFNLREEALALEDMHQLFPPELFLKNTHSGLETRQPVFIVGMPRSGSTLTEQILSSHPEIAGAGEIHHLSRACDGLFDETMRQTGGLDFSALSQETIAAFAETYLEEIRELAFPGAKAIVNKALGNFKYLGFIAMLFPHAKIIHCRRHPMDNCFSCFKTDFAHSLTTYNYTTDLSLLGNYYGLYHQMMEYWKQVLPVPFFEVVYEDMVADQETITRQLLDYCGLPWHPACLEFHRNPRVAATASEIQVKKTIYHGSVGKWKHFIRQMQPTLTPIRNLIRRWELQPPTTGVHLSPLARHLMQQKKAREQSQPIIDPPAGQIPPAPHHLMPLTIDTFSMESSTPPFSDGDS